LFRCGVVVLGVDQRRFLFCVVEQVPAIGNLDRVRRCGPAAFGVASGAVSTDDDLGAGMGPQPACERLRKPVCEKFDRLACAHVDQHRAEQGYSTCCVGWT
jgi:hypothetical protein